MTLGGFGLRVSLYRDTTIVDLRQALKGWFCIHSGG